MLQTVGLPRDPAVRMIPLFSSGWTLSALCLQGADSWHTVIFTFFTPPSHKNISFSKGSNHVLSRTTPIDEDPPDTGNIVYLCIYMFLYLLFPVILFIYP